MLDGLRGEETIVELCRRKVLNGMVLNIYIGSGRHQNLAETVQSRSTASGPQNETAGAGYFFTIWYITRGLYIFTVVWKDAVLTLCFVSMKSEKASADYADDCGDFSRRARVVFCRDEVSDVPSQGAE